MKLYEIAASVVTALDRLVCDDGTGEIPEDMAFELDTLQMEFSAKAENICRFRQQLQAQADAASVESARLALMARTAKNRADWLKDYLLKCMELVGQTKLKTELFSLSICKNSRPSFSLLEGSDIPPPFARVTVAMDGQAIYDAWRAGKQLPPEIVMKHGSHLRIT